MKKGLIAGIVLVFMFLVNAFFGVITYPELGAQTGQDKHDSWHLAPFIASPIVDIGSLLSSGFWGEVATMQTAAPVTETHLEKSESEVLRQRVKTIVRNNAVWQVVFEVEGEYVRLDEGAKIPGTRWWLVRIYPDRLELTESKPDAFSTVAKSSMQEPDSDTPTDIKILRLFSANLLETVRP